MTISESRFDERGVHGYSLGCLSDPAAAGGRDDLLSLARDSEDRGIDYGLCCHPVGHRVGSADPC